MGPCVRRDDKTCVRILATRCARGLQISSALKTKGAGKTGCALHPRSRVQCASQEMRTRAYRFSGNTPAFPAQWLYGLYRALPGESEPLATIAPGRRWPLKDLTPAIRASGPHDFAVRKPRGSSSRSFRPPSCPNVGDDGRRPLLRDRMDAIGR